MLQRVATSNTRTAVAARLHAIGGGADRCFTPGRSVQHLATQHRMLQHVATRCNAGQPTRDCVVGPRSLAHAGAPVQRAPLRVRHGVRRRSLAGAGTIATTDMQHVLQHSRTCCNTVAHATATCHVADDKQTHNRRTGWSPVRSCGRRSYCTTARAAHQCDMTRGTQQCQDDMRRAPCNMTGGPQHAG